MALDSVKDLEVYGVIGFDGTTLNGLKTHPNQNHVVYAMGNKVCILDSTSKKITFLHGHSNIVSTLAISPKGTYIGSGQINHIGFKGPVILWNFSERTMKAKHELHKVRVEALVFSCDESLMISIGGRDCGQIVVWDTNLNQAMCTVTAAKVTSGDAVTLAPMNKRPNCFLTGGDGTLRLWAFDSVKKAISFLDITLAKLKRYINCMTVSADDTIAYCGTSSGDIIKITLGYDANSESDHPVTPPAMITCSAKCGAWKKGALRPEIDCYSSGVRCIILMPNGTIVVGAGDGTLDIIEEVVWKTAVPKGRLCTPVSPNFRVLKTYKFNSSITSIQFMDFPGPKDTKVPHLLIGTQKCEVYSLNMAFDVKLLLTCHHSTVNDIAFPLGMSDVFATAGIGDIRVWALHSRLELLRIQVPNFICSSVLFSGDGKSIASGWNDGCIRAFTPITGRLMYCILNCHNKGTSALAMTDDGKIMISGGCEGQVRVWAIEPKRQTLRAVLKEHKCPVSAIKINSANTEAVSAGTDGSCIIWDIINICRRQILFANTVFMCAAYHPSGCQILTGGTDRMVAYWEAGTGNLAREVEASRKDAVNALHINAKGDLFATGGNDQKVKLWQYQEGIYNFMGTGHSGVVTAVSFSPNGKYLVSSSASGGVCIWKIPDMYLEAPATDRTEVSQVSKKEKKEKKEPYVFGPNKEENISTMNTSRSSIITTSPCSCREKSDEPNTKKGDGDLSSRSSSTTCSKTCNLKQNLQNKSSSHSSKASCTSSKPPSARDE